MTFKRFTFLLAILFSVALIMPVSAQGDEISSSNLSNLREITASQLDMVEQVSLNTNGSLLAVAEGLNKITILDVNGESAAPVVAVEVPDFAVHTVEFSPDDNLLAAGTSEGRIYILSLQTGETITIEAHDGAIYDVAWSPDSQFIYSGGDDGAVRQWDAGNGSSGPIGQVGEHEDWVRSIAVSADGRTVVSGGDDSAVRAWDVAQGTQLWQGEHDEWVRVVSISPDGLFVASGSEDNTIRLWNVADGTMLGTQEAHEESVISLAFSLDSTLLFSGSSDERVLVTVLGSGDVGILQSRDFAEFNGLSVSGNGNRIATGGADGIVTVFGIQ